MRWHHRRRGAISPEAFIPVFEESGLILPLSRWALTQSCRHAASWPEGLRVWVNVSPVQLRNGDLADVVSEALGETGLVPERLELEFRDSSLRNNPEAARRTLPALAELGVSLTLDRFSSGEGSANSLKSYPISKVKIDGALIAGIEQSNAAREIVHILIELAHGHNCQVVSTGVETEAQHKFLVAEGSDYQQGFYLGRPAPIEEFADIVGERPASRTDAAKTDLSVDDLPGFAAVPNQKVARRALS